MATVEQPEARWRPARLISGYGIKGEIEQEQRATSALLAVMGAVPDFGRAIVGRLGAPAGKVSTFTEIRFDDDGQSDAGRIPDGALLVQRGKSRWACLVEVKTGPNALIREQIEAYLRIARAHGVDGLLTISNDIVSDAGELPISVDKKLLKGLTVRHLSWWRILTMAIEQKEHRGISDPDQAWILGELISYLQDDRSGASGFAGMGEHWVKVREGARTMTLRPADPGVADVAERWEQFVEFLCLDLRQSLGRPVAALWARNTDRPTRVIAASKAIAQDGRMAAAIRIPDAAAPIDLGVDLRTRQFTTSTEVDAPKEGKALTRINWLLRQAKDMSPRLRIEARYPNVREAVAVLLDEARKRPERLLYAADPKREPRTFRLALTEELGLKRDAGQGSFLGASRDQVKAFYREVLQPIRPWQPSAPRLPAPSTDRVRPTDSEGPIADAGVVTTSELTSAQADPA
jgi:hypothetical protein